MAIVLAFSISRDSSVPIFAKLKWLKLVDIITINSNKFIFKAINGMSCEVTNGLFSFLPKRRTRSSFKSRKLENTIFKKFFVL
jgi:hypothetical protein